MFQLIFSFVRFLQIFSHVCPADILSCVTCGYSVACLPQIFSLVILQICMSSLLCYILCHISADVLLFLKMCSSQCLYRYPLLFLLLFPPFFLQIFSFMFLQIFSPLLFCLSSLTLCTCSYSLVFLYILSSFSVDILSHVFLYILSHFL